MATIRQKKLAKALVENLVLDKAINKKELLVSTGYATSTAESEASKIINSKGVVNELHRMGFNTEKAKEVVGEILQFGDEDQARLKAADMIFKVEGTYAPTKSINVEVKPRMDDKELEQTADDLLRLQKENP